MLQGKRRKREADGDEEETEPRRRSSKRKRTKKMQIIAAEKKGPAEKTLQVVKLPERNQTWKWKLEKAAEGNVQLLMITRNMISMILRLQEENPVSSAENVWKITNRKRMTADESPEKEADGRYARRNPVEDLDDDLSNADDEEIDEILDEYGVDEDDVIEEYLEDYYGENKKKKQKSQKKRKNGASPYQKRR